MIVKDFSEASGSGGFIAMTVYTVVLSDPVTCTSMLVFPNLSRGTGQGTPFVTGIVTPPARTTSIVGARRVLTGLAVTFKLSVPKGNATVYSPVMLVLNAGLRFPGAMSNRCSCSAPSRT